MASPGEFSIRQNRFSALQRNCIEICMWPPNPSRFHTHVTRHLSFVSRSAASFLAGASQTQRRRAPRHSRHIADRSGAGGAGGGRSGLTAPSPASGVAVGVVELQGGQQEGPLPFGVSVGWAWSSGPWCFARRASTGPWAGGRLLTAMYMAPAVGWALPWHPSCLCAGSGTAKPPPLPLASAKAGGPINPAPFYCSGQVLSNNDRT